MRTSPQGFTLIEVIVALTIGALVVLMVREAFGSVVDTASGLAASQVVHRARMSAMRRLEQVFESIEVTAPQSSGFEGDQASVAFSITDPTSKSGVRSVRLVARGEALMLLEEDAPPESLWTAERVGFDYLEGVGAQAAWMKGWHSTVAPLAVRLRLYSGTAADTLLCFIGPRG